MVIYAYTQKYSIMVIMKSSSQLFSLSIINVSLGIKIKKVKMDTIDYN